MPKSAWKSREGGEEFLKSEHAIVKHAEGARTLLKKEKMGRGKEKSNGVKHGDGENEVPIYSNVACGGIKWR